ncbi:MAG: diguanylate cyclase [Pseudomonadota bacterium]|nr:diguanylate cyclase [Pseudomonadota bacterium]
MRRSRFFVILAYGLACVAASSPAQTFLGLDRYTPEQGLSQHAVTAITEDERGLLWIGTQEGLNRYDGRDFTVFRNTPGDSSRLASSSIDSLQVDGSRLWVGTNDSGLEVIDLPTWRSRRLASDEGLMDLTVTAVLLDPAGGAWLGTSSGVERVDADLSRARRLGATSAVVGLVATGPGTALALDADCRLWQADLARLLRVPVPIADGARCVGMRAMGDDVLLATAGHGVYVVQTDGSLLRHLAPRWLRSDAAELSALRQMADGRWMLGYADGAVLQARGGWRRPPERVSLEQPIGSAVTGFHEHRSGVLWIGSATSGLFRVRALSSTVRRDLLDAEAVAAWPERSVRSILRDGAAMLVGTDSGLVLRARPGGDWRVVESIGATSVRAIAPARGGGWWIGTHRGLWRMRADGGAEPLPGLPHPQVTAVLVEEDRVWVATRGGLASVRNGRVETRGVPPVLDGKLLTSLARDGHGRLWVGTNQHGVFRVESDGSTRQFGTHDGSLPHDSIWSLHADAEAMWLGSFSGGLLRLDQQTGGVTAITQADGLSNNVVYSINPGPRGRLWLSTNNGISVYDPGTGVVQVIRRGDGLHNLEYNSGASFTDRDGLLYLGGTDGLDILDPARLPVSSPGATPLITGLRVIGRESVSEASPRQPSPEMLYTDLITLDHGDQVLSLDLVAMDFTASDSARLRYRIEGLTDEWVQPQDAEANLMLSSLPPGNHVLEVQAAGRDGRFGSSRRLLLVMQPPPWRHPVAYAAYMVLGLLLLGLAMQRARSQAERKQSHIERLNRLVAERTEALEKANTLLLDSNQQLESATRIDPLTQVSNRRDLQQWLDRECPQFIQDLSQPGMSRHCMLFCVIDLDDFKRINDSHGHQVGDEVLVEVARRLREVCRERDILVRWGGEEFLLLVRDAQLKDAAGLAERIRRAIADEPIPLDNRWSLRVTGSVGLAPWPLSARWPALGDWEQSVSLADRALYAAKASGKNAWVGVVPGPEVDRSALRSLLAGAAPEALQPGAFQVLHSTSQLPLFDRGDVTP